MKIKLDTKKKEIVFENAIYYKKLERFIKFILPEYFEADGDFKINTGTVSGKSNVEIILPFKLGWDYTPLFEWIQYKGGANVILDGCKPCSDTLQNKSAVTLIEGIYIIDVTNM